VEIELEVNPPNKKALSSSMRLAVKFLTGINSEFN
jgi:hypothetical protein